MKMIEEINNVMRQAVGMKGIKELCLGQWCLEDLREEVQVQQLVSIAEFLKRLEGKTIRRAKWENRLDRVVNPRGTLGQLVVEYTDSCSD